MNQLFNLIHLVEKEGKRSLKMAAVFKEQHNTIVQIFFFLFLLLLLLLLKGIVIAISINRYSYYAITLSLHRHPPSHPPTMNLIGKEWAILRHHELHYSPSN